MGYRNGDSVIYRNRDYYRDSLNRSYQSYTCRIQGGAVYKRPEKIRIRFKSTDELNRYRGFGIDTDIKINWVIDRETASLLILVYPENFISNTEYPDNKTLVSAVLCTCTGRENFARQAIREFNNQTWKDKELIIVNQGEKFLTEEENITEVLVPSYLHNGAMRNIGDALARGGYIVRVDDDDLYHPDRFKIQMNAIQETGAPASSFQNIINYVPVEDIAWVRALKCSPGLMMYRNEGRKYISDLRKSSDTYFMAEHYIGQITTIDNPPEYYIRIWHGINQLTTRKGLGEWDLKRGERKNDTGKPVDWDYFEKRIKTLEAA